MVIMNNEKRNFYEQELVSSMLSLTNGSILEHRARELAQRAVKELDWSDSALQHKGLGWVAGQFLQKVGYNFNYASRAYELV